MPMPKIRWHRNELLALKRSAKDGLTPEQIADDLGKPIGSVLYRMEQLGIAPKPKQEPPLNPEDIYAAKSGDLAFKQAMIAAIRRGEETAIMGVAKARKDAKPHWIRSVRAIEVSYRSSALMMAECGGE